MAFWLDQAQNNSSLQRNVSWCLCNMMKGQPQPNLEHIAPAVPALIKVLMSTDRDVIINDICWGLSFLTQTASDDSLRVLVNSGAVPRIVQLIEHAEVQIAVPSLRTIGNLLSTPEPQLF